MTLTSGCSETKPRFDAPPTAVAPPQHAAVIFFVDGANASVINALLQQGRLPNIQRLFVDGGVSIDHAVTVLPSITYPATSSILTGRYPGHHGILGNVWFDPTSMQSRDYTDWSQFRAVNKDLQTPTIFEMLKDDLTVSIQCHTSRGADYVQKNLIDTGIDYLADDYLSVDHRVGESAGEIIDIAQREGRWPRAMLFYFPGVDEICHRFGTDSAEYRAALENVDDGVGKIVDTLEQGPRAGMQYLALVSDHGHTNTLHNADLATWISAHHGLRCTTEIPSDTLLTSAKDSLKDVDAVLLSGAFRRVIVHLRPHDGWGTSSYPSAGSRSLNTLLVGDKRRDLPGLINAPGAGVVAMRLGSDKARITSVNGVADVERRTGPDGPEYRVIPADVRHPMLQGVRDANDPLEYHEDPDAAPLLDGEWHTSREWLTATANCKYPDVPAQVVDMFDSPRAGTLVVFAAPGWAFSDPYNSGHGSCTDADMHVPMYFAGPDLPAGTTIDAARLVDLVPTLLDLLGETDLITRYQPLDGASIADDLRGKPTR